MGKGLGWGGRAAELFRAEGHVQPVGIDLTLFSTEFMLKNHTIELQKRKKNPSMFKVNLCYVDHIHSHYGSVL